MTSRTHEAAAAASLLWVVSKWPPVEMNWPTIIGALICNLIGSLLPDIDQASNRLWDMIPGGNTLGKILRRVFISHRTLSHSLIGFVIFLYFFDWLIPKLFNGDFVISSYLFWSLMIGYVSHLLADMLTEDGLPLLWPLKWKFGFPPIRSWRIKTGKWFERLIVFPGLVLFILFLFWKHNQLWWRLISNGSI